MFGQSFGQFLGKLLIEIALILFFIAFVPSPFFNFVAKFGAVSTNLKHIRVLKKVQKNK